MHEIGLCEGVLETVQRRADGRRVTAVRVRAGALHRVVEPAMASAFELVAAGTVADGARLDLVVVPARVHCNDCGSTGDSLDPWSPCASCGSTDLDVQGGDELLLESLTFESADHPQEKEMSHVPRHPG
jgi:hydrogenase nickel incorporation protein HypA/HybF